MNRKSLAHISKAYDEQIVEQVGEQTDLDGALFARIAVSEQPTRNVWPRLAAAAVVLAGALVSYLGLSSHTIETVRLTTNSASPWTELRSPVNEILLTPNSVFATDENKLNLTKGIAVLTSVPAASSSTEWQQFIYSLRSNFALNYEVIRELKVINLGTKYLVKTGQKDKLHLFVLSGAMQINDQKFKAGDHVISSDGQIKLQKLKNLKKLRDLTSPKAYDQKAGDKLNQFVQVELNEPHVGNGKAMSDKEATQETVKPKTKKKRTKIIVESGSELIGDVISETKDELKINVDGNTFTVQKKTILSRKTVTVEE